MNQLIWHRAMATSWHSRVTKQNTSGKTEKKKNCIIYAWFQYNVETKGCFK